MTRERTKTERPRALPLPTAVGLNRAEAAEFIGVSTTLFDRMVRNSTMPRPKRIAGRRVWDVRELLRAFDALPSDDDAPNPWD